VSHGVAAARLLLFTRSRADTEVDREVDTLDGDLSGKEYYSDSEHHGEIELRRRVKPNDIPGMPAINVVPPSPTGPDHDR
jgi:hypothetical protein